MGSGGTFDYIGVEQNTAQFFEGGSQVASGWVFSNLEYGYHLVFRFGTVPYSRFCWNQGSRISIAHFWKGTIGKIAITPRAIANRHHE